MTDLRRHARNCKICRHKLRESIERDFVEWDAPSRIAKSYRLQRSTIYLHMTAMGLLDAREKNVKAALSAFIERARTVRPSAAAFVSAVVALSKINAEGKSVERIAFARGADEFQNFTRGELEQFVRDGTMPEWYLSATQNASSGLLS